jgi:hypothetical protein
MRARAFIRGVLWCLSVQIPFSIIKTNRFCRVGTRTLVLITREILIKMNSLSFFLQWWEEMAYRLKRPLISIICIPHSISITRMPRDKALSIQVSTIIIVRVVPSLARCFQANDLSWKTLLHHSTLIIIPSMLMEWVKGAVVIWYLWVEASS